jgi:hypothetical protein
MLFNTIMDIDELRRANIRALEVEAGSPKLAADRLGMTYVQYVNLRDGAKDPRSGKKRGMRKETAWRFELAFGKPQGWLDTNHRQTVTGVSEPLPAPYMHPNETTRKIIALLDATDEAGRGVALYVVSKALKEYAADKANAA